MSDSPLDLDLKFLPDWLKEPANKNPYADFAGESEDRGRRRDFDRGPGRPGSGARPQGRGPRDSQNRGPRPGGGNRPQGGPALRGPGSGPRRDDRPASRPPREGQRDNRDARPQPERQERKLDIPLNIEFLPEIAGIAGLVKQIKSSHRAYPLYGLGRMFLNKPERHRVRITSGDPAHLIFQIGAEGPVFLNRAAAEREAFLILRSRYYTQETVQLEAPKGNFVNVARCRLSGVLLGPTSHHGYQPALRRLFETRFSRRMDFNEFLRQIEVVSDPAVIEQWKLQCSSATVYRTTQEAEPLEFKTVPEVEAHFRANYLEKEVRGAARAEISGIASREVSDTLIRNAIRNAWEKERGFPSQIVNHIRPHFLEAGLHIWKHRKRILFVSIARPVRFPADSKDISGQIADLLAVVESTPKCNRTEISNRLLKPREAEVDFQKIKASLASDLHWLVQSGHVIEFHDGTLDLPLLPKELEKESQATPNEQAGELQSAAAQPAKAAIPAPEAKAEPEVTATTPEEPANPTAKATEATTVPEAVEAPAESSILPAAATSADAAFDTETPAKAAPEPKSPVSTLAEVIPSEPNPEAEAKDCN